MRVRFHRGLNLRQEGDLSDAIRESFNETYGREGQIERLSDQVENLITGLSILIELLVDKGVLTLDDVNNRISFMNLEEIQE